MITKERLQELIEQGATIWNDEWEEIKLDKNTCEICELQYLNGEHLGWCLQFQYDYEGEYYRTEVNLEDLEEDVEKGHWVSEMSAIRIETLKLPTWEEFITDDKYNYYGSSYFGFDNYRLIVKLPSEDDDCEFIGIDVDGNTEIYHWEEATKENYIEACKLCLRLFKGEEA